MERHADVAIIGGGFSGTMVAAQLLKHARRALTLALVERCPPTGRGVAYGTRHPLHLLNIPAEDMSAWPDDPGHFERWVYALGVNSLHDKYISRGLFGRYVGEQLEALAALNPSGSRLERFEDEAVAMLPAGEAFRIRLASGTVLVADQVVLALGQFPPAPLRVASELGPHPGYVDDAWRPEALAPLPPGGAALLVGTGLTAVDVAIALLDATPDATVHLVSRRAQLPAPQREEPLYHDWFDPHTAPTRTSQLARLIRRELVRAAAQGVEWRAVIDALKPHLPALWQRLPLVERRRFLRHARSYWEAHRNRLPPPTAERVEAYKAQGRLVVHAARLRKLESDDYCLSASLRTRQGEDITLRVERVVNCTGPDTQYRQINHPLVLDVVGTGLGRPDPLGLGLDVAPDGRLKDEDGVAARPLYTLGWPRQGQLWEATTVPSLRVQAQEVAERVLAFKA